MNISSHTLPGSKARLAILLGFIFVSLFFIATIHFKRDIVFKRVAPHNFITFTGLSDDAKIEATLKNRIGTMPLAVEGQKIVLSNDQQNNFYLPYVVNATIREDGKVYDLAWDLDANGVFYNVFLGGFRPFDKIAVQINDNDANGSYGMDWSGRTVLEIILLVDQYMKICATIEADHPFGFCQIHAPSAVPVEAAQ